MTHHFSVLTLEGRRGSSTPQTEVGLPEDDKPIIGMVGRLVEQKGYAVSSRRSIPSTAGLESRWSFSATGDNMERGGTREGAWK
jgi:hypothetical protein